MELLNRYPYLLAVVALGGLILPLPMGRFWFLENGLIENLQLLHLVLAAGLAAWATIKSWKSESEHTPGFAFIAVGLLWCAHRETDGIWEMERSSATFAFIRAAIFLAGLAVGTIYFKGCINTLRQFISTAAIKNFAIGTSGYIAAQIIPMMVLGHSRFMKRALEESMELTFGSFILLGAVELFALASAFQEEEQPCELAVERITTDSRKNA